MKRYAIYPLVVVLGFGSVLVLRAADAGTVEGKVSAPKPTEAVVYVEKVDGSFPAAQAKMDQAKKEFIPRVLAVVEGTTVEFHNSDDLQHNVFGVGGDEFDLGNWNKGEVRKHTFNKPGEATLLCNVHPEMEATILVLENPYFAQPDANGNYSIADVPAGEYVVKAWYRGKTKKQTVKVTANGNTSANF